MNEIDLISERDRLYLRAIETNDPDDWSAYEIMRRLVEDRLGIKREAA